MAGPALDTTLRSARIEAGLSQAELAAQAGISRQAVSAIETGRASPTIEVALRLARALGCPVDSLFRLVEDASVTADLVVGAGSPPDAPMRVQVARVGGRVVARALAGRNAVLSSLPWSNGLLRRPGAGGRAPRVDLFTEPDQLDRTLLLTGCDPAIALLADHFHRRYPSLRLAWQNANSTEALQAVGCGHAHIAGSHLANADGDGFNSAAARRYIGQELLLVAFADWEQGIALAPGNPLGVRNLADLGRGDVRLINREIGSGARLLLDEGLARAGVSPEGVRGYDRVVHGHLAAAEAVAAGLADAAITVRSAAHCWGLSFVPLAAERYDLVVPAVFAELPPVQALLEVLSSRLLRREVEALGGYDAHAMGEVTRVAD
ncbi:MAG TPA: substrate-binding domain-containing protein [Bacillota bacterium]